jgi:hypothetical protein
VPAEKDVDLMRKKCWHIHLRALYRSRNCGFAYLATIAIFSFSIESLGADTLVYSFETGLEGFTNNGAGITVTQDTIGATHGTNSMKVALTGPTFVGAQTAPNTMHPAIGDPPGLDHVTFDLTFTQPFPEGGFAVVGVMVFGVDQAGEPVQLQTGPHLTDETLEWHIDGKVPDTYRDITIDMTRFTHPVTFEPDSTFNDIVGTQGSGPFDMIPTSFQLYFNKTGGLGFPLTVYIDNIRVGMTMAGTEGDYNDDGVVDTADYVLWRKLLPTGGTLANDNTPGADAGDYDVWVEHFGEPGAGGGGQAVPEPAAAMMLAVLASFCATARRRAVR